LANYNGANVGAKSDKGPVRPANEDAFWVSDADTPTELGALYLVADGVGGQVQGAEAAQQAAHVISRAFYEARLKEDSVTAALDYAINVANNAIYERAQELDVGRMGCTLVAAVQHDGHLFVAHVGDARAYLLTGNRLRRLTRDDTWVQKQVEAGIITTEQAEKHELRNVVTQVLGNKPEINVHMTEPQELATGDAFLLSSDGLHGVLSNEQLFLLIRNNQPQEAAEALVNAAIQAETRDNVTAVVVRNGPVSAQGGQTIVDVGRRRSGGIRLPLWAAGGLVLVIILLVFYSIARLLASSNTISVDLGSVGEGSAEAMATETAVAETALPSPVVPAVQPPPTVTAEVTAPQVEPLGAASPPLEVTTASEITETATSQVASTTGSLPSESGTATPALLGCVLGVGEVFVWQDDQVRSNTCDHFAEWALAPGEQVIILDINVISVAGPDPSCRRSDFIKVQSVEDSDIEGWVTADRVLPMPFGGSC
jgi:protein phosphatase